jgi:hypothetical protein
MHRRLASTLLTISAGLLIAIGHAGATTITSTGLAAWKTSLTGSATELDFSRVQFANYNTASGIALNAIGNSSIAFGFTGPDNGGYVLSGSTYNGFVALAGSTDAGAGINIATPAGGENAVWVSIGSTSSTPLTLTFSDGQTFTLGNGFFGVSISHMITSLLITTTPGSQAVINDFWFGTSSLAQDQGGSGNPSSAPEAATAALIAGGLLIVAGARRRAVRAVQAELL